MANTPIKLGPTVSPPGEFNVKSYGAIGNGIADDTAAVQSALDALSVPATVYFPPGTYALSGNGMLLSLPAGSVIKGAGTHETTVKAIAGIINWMAQFTALRSNITFEDMTFDTNALATGGVVCYGNACPDITFRRCRFIGGSFGLGFSGMVGAIVEDCEFFGGCKNLSHGIAIDSGSSRIKILNNKFHYLWSGVTVGTGGDANTNLTEWLTVEGNEFKNQWWTWPTLASNSGGTVTYANDGDWVTVLTDSAGIDSSGVDVYGTIRMLEVRRTGTITAASQTHLEDSGAAFVADGTIRCEIIRTSGKFTTVTAIESATKLRIDGWLDSTTYLPVAAPTGSYTLYKVITGRVSTKEATTIHTYEKTYDFNGDYVLPAAGTLYEIYRNPNYPLHIEYGGKNIRIAGNIFRGGWADQCSVYCNRAQIVDNTLEDGQDVGITLNGTTGVGESIVANNRVQHQGTWAIYLSGENCDISGNNCSGNGWTNHINKYEIGGIALQSALNSSVRNNRVRGLGMTFSRAGISLRDVKEVTVSDNHCDEQSRAGIVMYLDSALESNTGIKLRDNRCSITHLSDNATIPVPPGFDYGALRHDDLGVTGTPEGSVIAGIGTTFHSSTGAVYFKRTGSDATGWALASMSSSGAAAPTTGVWAVADIIYNTAPAAGGVIGWVCTVAGGFGTAWVNSTLYIRDTLVSNDSGKIYRCITSGTSAGAGGPTGTSADITDGTAHWKYVAPAAPTFKSFGSISS